MAESLLGFILARLDQIESPVFLHRELERFPARDLAALLSEGLLRETSRATEIPRPAHLPAGGDLIIRPTSKGLFGVADEDDYFIPIALTDDDVRQYEVSLAQLVARIRRENSISGTGFDRRDGLVPLGQKAVEGVGQVETYLAFPNEDEATLLSRCRRLQRTASGRRTIVLTPRDVPLAPEGRSEVDACGVTVIPMAAAAATGSFAIDWTDKDLLAALNSRRSVPGTRQKGGRPRLTPQQARGKLLRAIGRYKKIHSEVDLVTQVHVAKAARVSQDSISGWLAAVGWTIEDAEAEWARRRPRKPE
ncbi:MAG TPA: hypothetical protein VFC31_13075 [Candidatus Limnocylindria bacterium]|nr:hypothetical protein [Candidatus Limnocylindria bacterium]